MSDRIMGEQPRRSHSELHNTEGEVRRARVHAIPSGVPERQGHQILIFSQGNL